MPTDPEHRPLSDAPTPSSERVTPEDWERYGDEDQVRSAWDEGRLHDEQPPHHR
ncbi:hypothetical protein [Mycobacterium sp. Lab-001]|uniref:hypothetical protein n=1 Tax=Mycobacterium sp. Lab-001 TaxID=3410136 RepID=UPI003D1683B8